MDNKKLSRVEILEQIKKHEEEIKVASRLISSYIRIEKERLEEQLVTLKQQSHKLENSLTAYQKQLKEPEAKEPTVKQ